MVETRRMVHAFGRGSQADDLAIEVGQEPLQCTTYHKGWPGKVSRFVLWEFQEYPTEKGDEEAERAAQKSFAHVSDRAHAGVVVAFSPEGAEAGYLKIRPTVSEDTPIILVVGGDAARAEETLKWVDAQGIPRGDTERARRATAKTIAGKQRRRSSGTLRRMKSVYQYAFACAEDSAESGMAKVAGVLLTDAGDDGRCALM